MAHARAISMRRALAARLLRGFVAALIVGSALAVAPFATAASAATEIGSSCEATIVSVAKSETQIERAAGVPVATPAAGVITKWKVKAGNVGPLMETLKVYKRFGSELEAIAESTPGNVEKNKVNEFATRLPVPAGAIFGGYSPEGIPYCFGGSTPAGDVIQFTSENIAVGTKKPGGTSQATSTLSLLVTVEPDADGDGYGDETQDQCPTNAAVQTACPTTAPGTGGGGSSSGGGGNTSPSMPTGLSITAAKLEGNTVAVKLSSTVQTQVTVTGSVKGKPGAAATKVTVTPGAVGRAYLTLSKSLKERLAKLPRKQHLNLVIEAQAPGTVPASRELPLPGRKKPPPKHPRH
jgi:hypothetical protein